MYFPPSLRAPPGDSCSVLVPSVRRFKVADTNAFHVCNAHAHEGLLRETAKQQDVKLAGALVICSQFVRAKGRRATIPSPTSSRKAIPLQRVCDDHASPRKVASAGGGLYLILFKDDATRMGWLYPFMSRRCADVTTATRNFLADVGGVVESFRTDNGTKFSSALWAPTRKSNTRPRGWTGQSSTVWSSVD